MRWKVRNVEELRMRFISAWQTGDDTMTELCAAAGISRDAGYRWRRAYEAEGLAGLRTHSSAPHSHPNAVAPELSKRILAAKRRHPTWGALKLLAHLRQVDPDERWPAASTVSCLLDRAGLTRSRRRRPSCGEPRRALTDYAGPNVVWCIDFKGWFRCGNGDRCDPLTLIDGATRYLLRCQALDKADYGHVKALLEAAFGEYGLPRVLRSDNGSPFATRGFARLSRLAVWLVHLGVRPELTAPGSPDQNGRQERFHRTLKAECANPPAQDLVAQQRRFHRFRREYNEVRPHQALDQMPPSSLYTRSERRWPRRLPMLSYPDGMRRRLVRKSGCIRWKEGLVEVGSVLVGETLGFAPLGDDDGRYWRAFLGPLPLAVFDERYGLWVNEKEAERLVQRYWQNQPWHW